MAQTAQGIGGLTYDPARRHKPPELNVLLALVVITAAFELIGRLFSLSSRGIRGPRIRRPSGQRRGGARRRPRVKSGSAQFFFR